MFLMDSAALKAKIDTSRKLIIYSDAFHVGDFLSFAVIAAFSLPIVYGW